MLNPLNAELNPICYLLALLGAHHFLHVSRIRVKFAVRKKAELIRSLKELLNITGTVLNNKTRYSVPPTALQTAVNPWLGSHTFCFQTVPFCTVSFQLLTSSSFTSKQWCTHWSIASELSFRAFLVIRTVGSLRTWPALCDAKGKSNPTTGLVLF